MTNRFWCPVFEDKDGNRLIFLHKDYIGETKDEAEHIRLGCMLVECIILGLKPREVRELGEGIECPNFEGYITGQAVRHPIKVAFIAGPQFDQGMVLSNSVPQDDAPVEST